jgi:hypothetical protein
VKKLDDKEGKENYQVEMWNRYAALENLYESVDINSAWESISDNIKMSVKKI